MVPRAGRAMRARLVRYDQHEGGGIFRADLCLYTEHTSGRPTELIAEVILADRWGYGVAVQVGPRAERRLRRLGIPAQ